MFFSQLYLLLLNIYVVSRARLFAVPGESLASSPLHLLLLNISIVQRASLCSWMIYTFTYYKGFKPTMTA